MLRPLLILAAAILSLAQATAPATAPATRPPVAPTRPDPALDDLTTYLQRASKLKEDDIEGRLTLARWARDRKMYAQAAEMADQVLYRDPGNRAAYLILQQVDDARPLPEEHELEISLTGEMKQRFSHEFQVHNTKHFLVIYDTTNAFALQRAIAMEKAYDAFQFYFNMSTLRPEFLQDRLVMILLRDRDDYLSYGRKTEGKDFSWSGGFYSQATNRSIFFDEASAPSNASFKKQLDDTRFRIEDLTRQVAAAQAQGQTGLVNQLSVERARANELLAQLTLRMQNQAALINNSTTMHEAAHQVSFNMGIQTRNVDYPFWFAEGLACSFEFEDALGHRGPALVNFGRSGTVKEAANTDKLIPLEQLIRQNPEASAENKTLTIAYAQSWALFHYLYKYHRDSMEKYILSYKTHAPFRAIGPDERMVLFKNAFGTDVDALSRKFTDYVKSLPGKPA